MTTIDESLIRLDMVVLRLVSCVLIGLLLGFLHVGQENLP